MIEHFAVTWLVNALWIVPLLAVTTALCARFGGLGPRGRHAAWLAALALAVSLPSAPAALLPFHLAPAPRADARAPPVVGDGLAVMSAPPADPAPPLAFDHLWTRAVLCLVGVVLAIALCRLLVAIWAGSGLVGAARPHDLDPALRRALGRVAPRDTRPLPPILESDAIASPVVVGVARPAILVPPGFADLCWDEQCAALLHEMAHVARRDYAWNLVCEAVSLPLAWHPAILPIKAGVRRSREAACDALAAEAMASRVTYAKCLVSIAARLGAAQPTSAVVVGLIGKSDLEERLVILLSPRPGRVSSVLRVAGAAAIAAAVLAPAVLLRVTPAFADEPVVARRLLAPAPEAQVAAATPVAHTAPVTPFLKAAPTHAAGVQRMAQAAAPIQPPSPPAPVARSLPAPPAPPAPPPPPADAMNGVEIHYRGAHGRYDVIVHRALKQALSEEKVMESDAMRHALDELRASQAEVTRAERAKLHAEFATAMVELDHARIKETLDSLRVQLKSSEFRNALAAVARQAAAAAAEVHAEDGKD